MENDFTIGVETPISDGTAVEIRPNWNPGVRSIVVERLEGARSSLFMLRVDSVDKWHAEPISLCNDGANKVMGRAAFFGQDDFAFVSDKNGSPAIWRAELGRRRLTCLTRPAEGEADYGPATRPDAKGRFYFFRIAGKGGTPHLYSCSLGEIEQPVSFSHGEVDQPWPLGRAGDLVFHSKRDGKNGVYRQQVWASPLAERLGDLDEGMHFVTPYPSPDGKYVSFTSLTQGIAQIWVMRVDGTRRQQITAATEPSMFPAWSPLGDRLLFVRGDPTAKEPAGHLVQVKLTIRRR